MATQRRGRSATRTYKSGKISATVRRTSRTPSRTVVVRKPSRARSAPAKLNQGRKAAAPKTQGSQLGYKSATLSLAKPMSRAAMTSALTKSMLESVVLRWNGVKSFTGNGFYWMQNRVVGAGVRSLPWYMMDLTAVNNWSGAAAITTYPMLQLKQATATGNMYFDSVTGIQSDGVSTAFTYLTEKAPVANTAILVDERAQPFGRSMIQSASISANLWGATAKATKYMVQIVQIKDDDLVPDHILAAAGTEVTKATAKRNDFYQNMIKSWTFNPIATTGGLQARKYKVLKTQTITIEPNPTTDGDADPQCVVYKAFLKLNKICKYEETSAFLTTDADTNDQADYARNTGAQITAQVSPKSRIYLVIRATNYGVDAGDTNVNTPSFDLSVRIRHTIPK